MQNTFESLIAPGVKALKPYQPGKPISELEREYGVSNIIKLASNENPLGPSPMAIQAMADVVADLGLYPDGNGFDLKTKLAEKFAVSTDQITLGNGSNDVLVLLAEAFLTPQHNAVYSQYGFAVYPLAIQAVGAAHQCIDALPTDSDMPLGHDLDAMADAIDENTRLVFVANPNNPTGTFVCENALRAFIEKVPADTLCVIDEAYFEYADPENQFTALQWLDDFPNLVVTRTFSKAYGLAGLRVGYSISHPDVANVLNRIRQPFNVNSLALAAAEAALDDDDFLHDSRVLNKAGLQQLSSGLTDMDITVVPSAGNFVLADFGQEATPIYEDLLRAGVIVRPVGAYGLPNHLRITVGTDVQNARLLDALPKVLGQ